jgi:hypothetical protein
MISALPMTPTAAAAAEALGHGHQIRFDAGVLDRKHAPVRAMPVWISSMISTMPCLVHSARSAQEFRRRDVEAAFTL